MLTKVEFHPWRCSTIWNFWSVHDAYHESESDFLPFFCSFYVLKIGELIYWTENIY